MYITESIEGNTIQIGRNKDENDNLVKESEPDWIWFHTDKGPSPHGVIQTDCPTKQEIYQTALLVKERSKLKNLRQVKINYCPVKNLKPTSTPGEVILKRRPKMVLV